MTAKHIAIGIDGADLGLIKSWGPEKLPTLHSLMTKGEYAHLQSVLPFATLPNWATFLTGKNPGEHGVFDFTTRHGYKIRFDGPLQRALPTVFSHWDKMGLETACVGFPGTWPPEKLERGVFVSGWDSPVAFRSDSSFVWPPSLYTEIVRRFGAMGFDHVDQMRSAASGWIDVLGDKLCSSIQKKTELASWLIEGRDWDVVAFYFGETDTASHYLWSLHDAKSPRRPSYVSPHTEGSLLRVYQEIDKAVLKLSLAAGENAVVTLVSDHGSGGAGDKVLYLNRLLEAYGWLSFKSRALRDRAIAAARGPGLGLLGPASRERLFSFAESRLPGWLESQTRFGGIDMRNTRAFSDELNYFPAIYFNIRGREPLGQLDADDVPRAFENLRSTLLDIKDPWTHARVFQEVHLREDIYTGLWVDRAPDVILELNLDDGYSYNLMPSIGAPAGTGPWRKLADEEYLGRKGRSLPGSHRARGLYIHYDKARASEGEIALDMVSAGEIFSRSIPVLHDGDHVLRSDVRSLSNMQNAQHSNNSNDTAQVESRLRALGYID